MFDTLALPEIFLAIASMAILLYGVFSPGNPTRSISWLTVLVLLMALVMVWLGPDQGEAFGGLYVQDGFAVFLKVLVLLSTTVSVILSLDYIERENMARFEFPVLMLLSTLGMLLMLSANDLIALYVGFELQSLPLYVVAAFRRDTLRSTEAGLKYFVLGALSSGILLYGASMIYGFAGTTSFDGIATALTAGGYGEPSIGLIVGLVFLAAGLAFKISAVPFHMWTPDVYEGAPTPVTTFFAVAPKIATMGLFIRVLADPFVDLVSDWQQIILFISVASMILGGFAAIIQTNIKRLMAYSSISNIGYALVGLAPGTAGGVRSVLLYLAIYLFMTVGTFAVILCMRQRGRMVEGIDDLAGLSKTHPVLAAVMAVFMFSMAGIPPLAGFFGKLYVFLAAIEAELYTLAVIGVVTSVVAAFYYLRIVKVMYFDEAVEAFDRPLGWGMSSILGISAFFVLFFILFQAPIIDGADAAAASLFTG